MTLAVTAVVVVARGVMNLSPAWMILQRDAESLIRMVHCRRGCFGDTNDFLAERLLTKLFTVGPYIRRYRSAVLYGLFAASAVKRERRRHFEAERGDQSQDRRAIFIARREMSSP